MKLTAITLVVIGAAMGFAFRLSLAGTPWFWVSIGVPYLALALLALRKLWDDGTLLDVLMPRWGDLSVGVTTGAGLLLASFGARAVLAPAGSMRQAWLMRIYGQIGDPET